MKKGFELVDPKSPRAGSKKFSRRQTAIRHLKELTEDPKSLEHMNDVWLKKVKGRSTGPAPQLRTVLNDLSDLLVEGGLRIARQETGSGGGGGKRKPPQSNIRPERRRPRGDELFIRPREAPVPKPPGPTPNIDQQVKTLIEAAGSGAAFCEICETPPASVE